MKTLRKLFNNVDSIFKRAKELPLSADCQWHLIELENKSNKIMLTWNFWDGVYRLNSFVVSFLYLLKAKCLQRRIAYNTS